ncbi:uncharacterized protein LOC117103084 [Anneissia japonica]|uniref:uncharacterized protein LOC117103084 n=1 Tax=Anneissia japonica TaxID=1529436 RepID=UPI001425A38D|nr:uncharacterized protein LOC117103084 [Anneissia japonica]
MYKQVSSFNEADLTMTSYTARGISFEGYSSIYDVEESHAVCIIMDSQNAKANVPTQKSNSTQKYKTDTKTSDRALLPKKPFINVGLLIVIVLVIIATVLVLEVGLKFNILSMSPKINVPLSETESNHIPQGKITVQQ